jgi:hypothetical protein
LIWHKQEQITSIQYPQPYAFVGSLLMELYNFVCQADPELEAIRKRRMEELMAKHGGGGVRYQTLYDIN